MDEENIAEILTQLKESPQKFEKSLFYSSNPSFSSVSGEKSSSVAGINPFDIRNEVQTASIATSKVSDIPLEATQEESHFAPEDKIPNVHDSSPPFGEIV